MFKGLSTLLLLAPAAAFLATPFAVQTRSHTLVVVRSEVESSSAAIEDNKEVKEFVEAVGDATKDAAGDALGAAVDAIKDVGAAIDASKDEGESKEGESKEEEKPERFSAFIGNLAFTTTFEDLRAECGKYGEVIYVSIPKDRTSDQPRGFAFVTMASKKDLDSVIEKMDGIEMSGRVLRVVESVPKGQAKPDYTPSAGSSGSRGQKLYIGNLSFDTSTVHLKEFMEEIGPVTDVYMPMNDDGNPRGFAFVTMSKEDAEKAISEINGYNFMGRSLTVSKPLPPGEKMKRQEESSNRVKMYVGNLSFQTSVDTLAELFEEFGSVYDCYLPEDPSTGSSRGFGFVSMDKENAMEAIAQIDGCELDGRFLRVNEALPRGQRASDFPDDGNDYNSN